MKAATEVPPEGTTAAKATAGGLGHPRLRELTDLGFILDSTTHEHGSFLRAAEAYLLQLFEDGRDDVLDTACRDWAGQKTGLLFRQCAESLAERVDTLGFGRRTTFGLFAVPLLFSLDLETPESQLDWALCRSLDGSDVGPDVLECTPAGAVGLAPRLYKFAEIAGTPLCTLRRRTFELAEGMFGRGPACWLPFSPGCASKKRSRIFLRFVVGQLEHRLGARAFEPSRRLNRLEEALTTAVSNRLHTHVEVSSHYDTSFHHAIYSGMWKYQAARLTYIARDACRLSSETEAVVHVPDSASGKRIRVGLRRQKGGPIEDSYLLNSRPAEPSRAAFCAACTPLRAGGIASVEAGDAALFAEAGGLPRNAALPI